MSKLPPWLALAVTYGVISYILGPMLGASIPRLISYAWPAFWIGAAAMLVRDYSLTRRDWIVLAICHIGACWLPWTAQAPGPVILALQLCAVCVLHLIAWRTLRVATPPTRVSA